MTNSLATHAALAKNRITKRVYPSSHNHHNFLPPSISCIHHIQHANIGPPLQRQAQRLDLYSHRTDLRYNSAGTQPITDHDDLASFTAMAGKYMDKGL